MSDRRSRHEPRRFVIPGDLSDPQSLRSGVEAFLDWLVARNYSVFTIELRHEHLAGFVAWMADRGLVQVQALTPALLEEYQVWLHQYRMSNGKARSIGSQYQRLTVVRSFCRFLARTGRLDTDLSTAIEMPKLGNPLPTPVLTADEVERLMAQPDVRLFNGIRDRAMLEVLFATGIRRQELSRLCLDDIDLATQTLVVRRGKGNRGRMVPISERALTWVTRYVQGARWYFLRGHQDDGVLFLTRFGEPCGLAWLSQMVGDYMDSAGIDKTGGCHVIRATAATLMLEGGANLRYIQEFLGHSSIASTQRYTRVSLGALRLAYERAHPSANAPKPLGGAWALTPKAE